MNRMIELEICEAAAICGGKNEETAQLVSFIAECIGSIAKMIYLANQMRKMLIAPTTF